MSSKPGMVMNRRLFAKLLSVAGLPAGLCLVAQAHPLGNFSVSHYARFDIRPEAIELTYALDLAELPTFELLQSWNLDGRDREAVTQRAMREARAWLSHLRIRVDARELLPRFQRADAHVSDGAAGLPVLRVAIAATLPAAPGLVEYEDLNYPSRAGWKEVVIAPHEGVRLEAATQGAEDRSRALEAYPGDANASPPQVTQASFRWSRSGGGSLPATARGSVAPPPSRDREGAVVARGDYLSRMLGGGHITLGMLLIGLPVAFGLGALHALSPGHGKTIVAAYLVGSRGTFRHALYLGATVTFTHTAAVFALGIAVLFLERRFVPEKLIPLLGALSGLSIAAVGGSLLYRRARALGRSAEHRHQHHHHHDHGHTHPHAGRPHSHAGENRSGLSSLIALGVSGGLVPCPSALVLLLSAIALGQVALGLMLLTAFSAGLAAVLTAVGALVLYARSLLPESSRFAAPAFRYLPVFSAAVVTVLGFVMTAISLGWA